ncbi:MAG: DUF6999 family protein [Casimicrobium sp.]
MKFDPHYTPERHDASDPSPWTALYLDQSTPITDKVKAVWLADSSCASRQYLLPLLRPLARATIVLIQVVKIVLPKRWVASKLLHRLLAFCMKNFVGPEANWLILRHFHLGSQILQFVADNVHVKVPTSPIEPITTDDIKDEAFLKHDLNLYNFIIRLGYALRESGHRMEPVATPNFQAIQDPPLRLEDMPRGPFNILDLQTAIELFTPIYQLFLTDNDFWRASNSLQYDETIAIYCATILNAPQHLILLNNKHPLVPLSTLKAGYRLVLHGLSTEMLHGLLLQLKAKAG